jgi:hypothetical protein
MPLKVLSPCGAIPGEFSGASRVLTEPHLRAVYVIAVPTKVFTVDKVCVAVQHVTLVRTSMRVEMPPVDSSQHNDPTKLGARYDSRQVTLSGENLRALGALEGI